MSKESPCGIDGLNCDACTISCPVAEEIYKERHYNQKEIAKVIDNNQEESKVDTINISTSLNGFNATFIDLHESIAIVIWFVFKGKEYKVQFGYSTLVSNPHNSSGNKQEKQLNKINYIGNLKIQSKDKVGYGRYTSIFNNKYKDLGIKLKPLKKFIKKVLFEYLN